MNIKIVDEMGNQLYTLANMIGSVREHKIHKGILYLAFSYKRNFPNIDNIPEAKVMYKPLMGKAISRTLRILYRATKAKKFKYHNERSDDAGTMVQEWIKNGELDGFNVVMSFPYFDYEAVCKHHDYIIDRLRFDDCVYKRANTIVSEMKSKYEVVVGVHIRRKDYAIWHNGEFYFDDDVYYNASQRLKTIFRFDNHKVGYIICSDEDINLNNYNEDYYKSKGENAQEDLTILSMCDYIVATTSTFSGWASYVGKVPTFRIRPECKAPNVKEDFTVHFFETDGAGIRRDPSYL